MLSDVTAIEYLKSAGTSIYALAVRAGVSYTSLHPHVRHGRPLSVLNAKRLQTATSGAITAAEVLGLDPVPTPATEPEAA